MLGAHRSPSPPPITHQTHLLILTPPGLVSLSRQKYQPTMQKEDPVGVLTHENHATHAIHCSTEGPIEQCEVWIEHVFAGGSLESH